MEVVVEIESGPIDFLCSIQGLQQFENIVTIDGNVCIDRRFNIDFLNGHARGSAYRDNDPPDYSFYRADF